MAGLGMRPRTVVAPDGRDWSVGRVLLPRPPRWKRKRPWKIDARTLGPRFEEHTFAVVGLRASAEAVDTVTDAIRRGTPPDEIRLERR